MWHLLAFIVGAIVVGGMLVNVLISLATTGSSGLSDPTTWTISRLLLAHPIYALAQLGIMVCMASSAYLFHRRSHTSHPGVRRALVEEFGLNVVQKVVPTSEMIPFYRPTVYLPRRVKGSTADADALACESLTSAASRAEVSRFSGQVGICVVGRTLLGTTRLAWEAVHANRTLDSWIFIRWPEDPRQYVELWQALQQHHAKALLWLDDLSAYNDDRSASLIARLPYDLEEQHIPFVIVATLSDDQAAEAVRTRFGALLDHLVQIQPEDLTHAEANTLVAELTKVGESVYQADHFDGTPGSIVLALNHMRDEVYPRLPDDAKLILRTLKLLRSAEIREYRLDRVLRTTTTLFAPRHSQWTRELEALQGAGCVHQEVIGSGQVVLIKPTVEVYLDVAVPDYSVSGAAMDDWPKLQVCLAQAQDGYALVRLGTAFRKAGDDNRAETCYRSALDVLTRATAEQDWANAQFGLADVLSRRVDTADVAQRRKLLEQAEEAFNNALLVVQRESDPTFWAEIQGRRAGVIRHEATTTVGPRKRVDMLQSATKSCREALKILRRDTTPDEWAEAQQNLGLVLLTHAQFSQDAATRRGMLDDALDALTLALTVFTPESHAYRWARVQRALGDTCRLRADASNRPRKDELLRKAVKAYGHALDGVPSLPLWRPDERAEMLSCISTCGYHLGLLLSGGERDALLEQASEAAQASADGYASQGMHELAAYAGQLLGTIQYERSTTITGDMRITLLDEAIQANVHALAQLGRQGPRDLRPQMRLELARLYWTRATQGDQHAVVVMRNDIEETVRYAEQALNYFTRANAPAEYRLATKLQRDAKNKTKALDAIAMVSTSESLAESVAFGDEQLPYPGRAISGEG
jgi:tetratricopeptide (TPR) repeat protein